MAFSPQEVSVNIRDQSANVVISTYAHWLTRLLIREQRDSEVVARLALTYTLRSLPNNLTDTDAWEALQVIRESQTDRNIMIAGVTAFIEEQVTMRKHMTPGGKTFSNAFYKMFPEVTRVSGFSTVRVMAS